MSKYAFKLWESPTLPHFRGVRTGNIGGLALIGGLAGMKGNVGLKFGKMELVRKSFT